MADDAPFPIRLTGAPPPPPPPPKKSGRGGGRGKNPSASASPPPRQQRHDYAVAPGLTLGELKAEAAALFGVPPAGGGFEVKLLSGFPPRPIDLPDAMLVKDCVGRMEGVMVRFGPAGSVGAGGGSSAPSSAPKSTAKGKATAKRTARETEAADGAAGNSVEEDGMKAPGGGDGGGAKNGRGGGRKRLLPSASSDGDDDDDEGNGGSEAGENRGRPRRAAAEAASAGFAEAIRAQDRLMRAEKKKAASKRKGSKSNAGSTAGAASRANAAAARAAAAASRRMQSMGGYRLSDGAAIPPSRPAAESSSAGARKFRHTLGGSEDDVSYNLLSSIESGGGGKVGKFLRAAMRGAVGKSYERSRAVVRVDAVRSGGYRMQPKEAVGGRLGSGGTAEMGLCTVHYAKGVEGRGEYEETVEVIGLDALKAVIRAVHADADSSSSHDQEDDGGVSGPREMLRPANMAQLSPRVFWSLAHHFPNRDTETALRECCPDLDWSYLSGRTRILSEKARENKKQERVARGEIPDESYRDGVEGDYGKAAGAVEAVEEAMEKMYEEDQSRRRERAVRAAAARLDNSQELRQDEAVESKEHDDEDWRVVTPDETDEEELRECILEGCKSCSSDGEEVNIPKNVMNAWVQSLIDDCSVHNWRELANADAAALLPHLSKHATTASTDSPAAPQLDEPLLESILESARTRSIEEIQMEILDGDEDAVVSLREEASAGTPKDLANWADCPDMLFDSAPSLKERGDVGVSEVGHWCKRARSALGTLEWLEWYATPVA